MLFSSFKNENSGKQKAIKAQALKRVKVICKDASSAPSVIWNCDE